MHTLARALLPLLLAAVSLPALAAEANGPAQGPFVKFGLLVQGQGLVAQRAAPDAESSDLDLFLRRARILVLGQLNERVSFFADTDSPNLGRQGDLTPSIFVQDALLEFNAHPALQVDAGMLVVPFSHHGLQAAGQLHLLDFHADLLRYAPGSTKIWRDFGVVARGLLAGNHLEYRAGLFNGVHGRGALQKASNAAGDTWRQETDPRNPRDWPRLTARAAWHLFDAEGTPGALNYFYRGVGLKRTEQGIVSTARVLSFGASVDWQKDLNATYAAAPAGAPGSTAEKDLPVRTVAARDDYFALAADLVWDVPLAEGRMGFAGQVNAFHYEHGALGPDSFYDPKAAGFTGYSGDGVLAEAGFRSGAWEPVVGVDWFEAKGGPRGDVRALQAGLNWWWLAHSTNFKFVVSRGRRDGGPWGWSGGLQAQLLLL